MSFPPGTEMFQFPGFASLHYGFMQRYPIGVGCPIRTSTDQSLLAAPRGFSQRATSFIASWCQGIHRMPFSRSRSRIQPPPKLPRKTSEETQQKRTRRHAQHSSVQGRPHSAQNIAPERITRLRASPPKRIHRSDIRNQARPETHQNLIHPDKDQNTRHASEDTRRTLGFTCDTQTPASQTPASQTRWPDIHQPGRYEPRPIRTKPHAWWRRS